MTTQTTKLTCLPVVPTPLPLTEILNQARARSYSCPTGSPYVLSFMNLNTSFSYGIPIQQQIICKYMKPSKTVLLCPQNKYIHLLSVYYGIQADTKTACTSTGSSSPSMCFNQVIFDIVNTSCEFQNNCSVLVTVNNFGDPCLNYNTQVLLQYQCMDYENVVQINNCPPKSNITTICPTITDPTIISQNWCEPSVLSITCSPGNVIQIMCAFYGIDTSYKCPNGYYSGAPTLCYARNSYQTIFSTCNNKTTCLIAGNPTYLAAFSYVDPCYGFSKALYVQWKCVTRAVLNGLVTTTVKPTTPSLPYCPVNYRPNGTCPNIYPSIYAPPFLNSTTYSFDYPVYQLVVCQLSKVVLECQAGTVIHIYAAYFGIQYGTYTSCYAFSIEIPKMCYYPSAFNYIKNTCENYQNCLITGDVYDSTSQTGTFKSVCPVYPSQLFIQYQCVDSYALNSTIGNCTTGDFTVPDICPKITSYSANATVNETYWCDGSTMTISCPLPTQLITIFCAYYGLHPSVTVCNVQSYSDIPVCYFESSLSTVNATCSGTNSCSLDVSLDTFSYDPCENLNKVLYVQWSCN